MVGAATRTVELRQIEEINQRLSGHGGQPSLRAQDLGLTGTRVRANTIDTVAAHKAHLSAHLAARPLSNDPLGSDARLLHLVAAGSPMYPYIWGLFGGGTARREREPALTPVPLHT